MAVTVTKIYNTNDFIPDQSNSVKCAVGKVVFDSSYPTGGEAVDLQTDLDLPTSPTISAAQAVVVVGLAAGFAHAKYDHANELVLLYDSDGAQVSNATDASSVTVLLTVYYT